MRENFQATTVEEIICNNFIIMSTSINLIMHRINEMKQARKSTRSKIQMTLTHPR